MRLCVVSEGQESVMWDDWSALARANTDVVILL
jgi:hypothetical protein